MIPDSVVQEIRERVDLKTVVGEYVTLKRSGASYKGLCPFHNEKSPSFYVHPERGFFHCFGCGASGDAFAFVTRIEGLSFPDVVRKLAERVGVAIPVEDARAFAEERKERAREDRLQEVIELAAGFFLSQVAGHPRGHLASEMWRARGISDETAARFRLGYAPVDWDGLSTFLGSRRVVPADAEAVGLVLRKRSGSGYYDRFRHRLMFPIADHHGRIVAFSGRLLPEAPDQGEPGAKYINSPEHALYTKGKVLYGLYEGRVEIRRRGFAVLCEGNFDLVALHQAGLANAVAPMGTALTTEQGKLLRRYTDRVVLMFDGDNAGRKAVHSAYEILRPLGISLRVVTLPQGDDPDSFLQREGGESLMIRIENAIGIVEHLIDSAADSLAGDAAGAAEAIGSLAPILSRVENPVEGRMYLERIARRFRISDLDAIRRQLRVALRGQAAGKSPQIAQSNSRQTPPVIKGEQYSKVELEALGVTLDLELFTLPEAEKLGEVLTSADLCAIFVSAREQSLSLGQLDVSELVKELAGNPALSWLLGRLANPKVTDRDEAVEIIRKSISLLEKRSRDVQKRDIEERIRQAVRGGDQVTADRLYRELNLLLRADQAG